MRAPKPGYREHDHVTDYQECDSCGLRLGAGIFSKWNESYYAQEDPNQCPKCSDGLMCLPEDDPAEIRYWPALPRQTSQDKF